MVMLCVAYTCYAVVCTSNTISMCVQVYMCSGQGMDVHMCLDCEEDTRASKHGYEEEYCVQL